MNKLSTSFASIAVGNFKGIGELQTIELAPITVFIGENSSGKSTILHAFGALAQTIRASNDTRPLVLDDEFATVHLGRFIEVIHTHSYNDGISLGVTIPNVQARDPYHREATANAINVSCLYQFRSTMRTQGIYVDRASFQAGEVAYEVTRKGSQHVITKSSPQGTARSSCFRDRTLAFWPNPRAHSRNWEQFYLFQDLQRHLVRRLLGVHYLGPFRLPPMRRYPTRGAAPSDVGAQGENAVSLLANEITRTRTRPNIKQLGKWLNTLGVAQKLEVVRISGSDLFEILITLNDGKRLPIADLGYGLSQVLPVLTQCAFAAEGSTLLFEQPELHLHPQAQKPLAEVFIESAQRRSQQLILETHSRELFHAFLCKIRDHTLDIGDFIAYRVRRKDRSTVLEKIQIESVGDDVDVFGDWEAGFS